MKIPLTVFKLQSGNDFVMNRQTDDPGKNNMSPNPKRGDIFSISQCLTNNKLINENRIFMNAKKCHNFLGGKISRGSGQSQHFSLLQNVHMKQTLKNFQRQMFDRSILQIGINCLYLLLDQIQILHNVFMHDAIYAQLFTDSTCLSSILLCSASIRFQNNHFLHDSSYDVSG